VIFTEERNGVEPADVQGEELIPLDARTGTARVIRGAQNDCSSLLVNPRTSHNLQF